MEKLCIRTRKPNPAGAGLGSKACFGWSAHHFQLRDRLVHLCEAAAQVRQVGIRLAHRACSFNFLARINPPLLLQFCQQRLLLGQQRLLLSFRPRGRGGWFQFQRQADLAW